MPQSRLSVRRRGLFARARGMHFTWKLSSAYAGVVSSRARTRPIDVINQSLAWQLPEYSDVDQKPVVLDFVLTRVFYLPLNFLLD